MEDDAAEAFAGYRRLAQAHPEVPPDDLYGITRLLAEERPPVDWLDEFARYNRDYQSGQRARRGPPMSVAKLAEARDLHSSGALFAEPDTSSGSPGPAGSFKASLVGWLGQHWKGTLFGLAGFAIFVTTLLANAATIDGWLDQRRGPEITESPTGTSPTPLASGASESTPGGEAPAVRIEGVVRVANVTRGDSAYVEEIEAAVGDTVKLEVWYYNMENVDSGLYASGLTIRVLPTRTRSEEQVLTAKIFADNSNVVEGSAIVRVPAGAVVRFLPDSAKWRHNRGGDLQPDWVTVDVGPEVLQRGVVLEDAPPCLQCEATLTVLAEVENP